MGKEKKIAEEHVDFLIYSCFALILEKKAEEKNDEPNALLQWTTTVLDDRHKQSDSEEVLL